MIRLTVVTLLLMTVGSLAGCTTYWYQAGKTIDECKQDRLGCFEELKKYSSDWQDIGDYEVKFMEDCMRQKGYTLLKEGELPLRVRREDPDRLLHARLHGVAGTIE
ncbi:MAG: hypothetical protein ACYTBJ_05975 [Planctomycetota bacterium]